MSNLKEMVEILPGLLIMGSSGEISFIGHENFTSSSKWAVGLDGYLDPIRAASDLQLVFLIPSFW